ncbi:MAG TPA: hypothetical protein VGB28_07875 [Actinomycetota bacterium]
MKVLIGILLAAVLGVAVWAAIVFTRPEPRFGPGDDGPSPQELTAEEVRVLAMDALQSALAVEMRAFVDSGRFTADPDGIPSGVEVEVCEGDRVGLFRTTAADGTVLVLTARGLEPHSDGEAVFSHYTGNASCSAGEGPATWPGGYHVSRQGLMKGDARAEIPLS